MSDNPFSPGFGATPLILAGRDSDLAAIREVSLDLSRSDYGRTVVLSGQRGIGKTVLLNHAEYIASRDGWLVVSETVTNGFVERIIRNALLPALPQQSRATVSASLGVAVPPITASIGIAPRRTSNDTSFGLRPAMSAVMKASPHRGVLFTLDEVGSRAVSEMEDFVTSYQHLIREGYPVGLVIGGIPTMLSRLLARKDSATTFLNRAHKSTLTLLPYNVSRSAFRDTIALRGTRTASEEAIAAMTTASMGYPFLIQEIGKLAWDVRPDSHEISLDDVRAIIPVARKRFSDSVLSVIIGALPDRAKRMLNVIAGNPGIHTKELADELKIPITAVPAVKQQLLAAEVVEADGRAVVRIAVPYLQEYLRAQEQISSKEPGTLSIMAGYKANAND